MDNTTQESDREIEDAKASLMARVEELGRRIQDARHKLDVPAHIAAHPKLAVGVAFALGALFGLAGGGKPRAREDNLPGQREQRGMGGLVTAVLGALIMRVMKDFALGQVSTAAKEWLDPTLAKDDRIHDEPTGYHH
jgi:hypothetical protein